MLGYVTILIIFITLTTGWFIPYIGLVYLNSVFLSKYLTVSDVAGYSPSVWYPGSMDQYGAEWAIFLTEPLDFFAPWICLVCFLMIYANMPQAKYILRIYFGFDIVLIFFRFVYRVVSYGLCGRYGQLCRSLNPADKTSYFETTNLIWDILFWNNFAMLIWNLMLLMISWDISERAKRERDDDTKRVLVENGKSPQEIEALFYLKREEMRKNKDAASGQEPIPEPPVYVSPEDQPPIYIPPEDRIEKKQLIRSRMGKKKGK